MIPTDLSLLRAPGAPALSPDGTTVVFSVTAPDVDADEYTGALWTVPADGSLPPRRLTRGHRDTAPAWSPDGRWIAFLRAEPEGKPQLHVVEAAGGEPVLLTDAPLGVSEPLFSPEGTRIAYLARVPEEGRYVAGGTAGAEPPRHITTYRYRGDGVGFFRDRPQHLHLITLPEDPGSGPLPEPVALTDGDHDVAGHRWLPDGEALVATSAVHADREDDLLRDAVLVEVPPVRDGLDEGPPAGGTLAAPRPLTRAGERDQLAVDTVAPSADGRTLWFLATDMGATGREFVAAQTGLFSLDLDRARSEDGGPAPRRHTDVETVDLASGLLTVTRERVLVADQRRGAVVLLDLPADPAAEGSAEPGRVLVGGPVVVQAVSAPPVGTRAVAAVATGDSAGDLVVVDLGSGEQRQVTDLSAELRGTGRLRPVRELEATAPDGYPVHGWVATPDPDRFGTGPHPTILMIHGGPYAQYTHALFDEVQTLAEAGYAVVLGNPRGSAGYGAAHGKAIQRAFGTVDTDDVLALLDHALADADLGLDAERVGVMGGSYGGYLTAWLTTRTHRFAAAVVERGFLDPVSFVGSSDIGWFFGLQYVGDAATEDGAAALAAQSPMAHVGEVRTPTLVIHSENDWRCPVEQGQRWFVELKRRGVESELLLFPGEGHELTRSGRPRHRLARFEHVLAWWSRHLPVASTV
ncbi:S9 family peptidase [Actinotalea sp. BY-33]|uniref:S9 family peptidase n=1 Tax=Actinotalea soli TaxID=2819234 RepID=A0A939LRQ5_9CELL|nr:S9 family peptidase [Actinotalea soli]MBO1752833.1 S9 family peptidase [Actinotalea soli]